MELAINLTFVGITVVFVSLILLAIAITILSKVISLGDRSKSTDTQKMPVEIESPRVVVNEANQSSQGDMSDDTLIAVLTAAVMASIKNSSSPDCKIRVKSFRRIPNTSPSWNVAGRNDYISQKL